MTAFASAFLRTMSERGYIHQVTNAEGLDGAALRGGLTGYIGFDLTASSLHVGNLIQIMLLRRLQQAGHRPIVLLGGATTKVGDPSGKDQARKMLSPAEIAANKASIQSVFAKLLTFGDGPGEAVLLDNAEWLDALGYIEFLRLFGQHFTINRMLSFDSVRLRLDREQPLTFLEFNYMLMQAVDFLELSRRQACALQMGGSDQWGNIVNGVELTRRVDGREVFGLTTPLLSTASGAKMGKTAEGAVWLNPELKSPYEYWHFWRNTEDGDVARFLNIFTDLPREEIARYEGLQGGEINDAKRALANAATALLHGAAAAREAEAAARAAFTGGAGAALPGADVTGAELAAGLRLPAALTRAGLSASNGEAKRLIEQGAVAVNDTIVSDPARTLSPADLVDGAVKLTRGKTRHAMLRLV